MKLNEQLKKLRLQKGISVYRLSHMTDISQYHIRSIEKGSSQPSVLMLEKLLTALGSNLSEFFSEDHSVYYPTTLERSLLESVRQLDDEQMEALIHMIDLMNRR